MRVHIVDDNEGFRRSTVWCLELGGFEVEAFESAPAQLEALGAGRPPDVVLCDIRMPGMSGLEYLRLLRAERRRLPVVLMTGHADIPLAVEAMRLGADDFIEKPFDLQRLDLALREAAGRRATTADDAAARIATLTPRERQVLERVVAGRLNKQIADELGVSIKTVELHRHNMMSKLGVRKLAELVKLVLSAGGPS